MRAIDIQSLGDSLLCLDKCWCLTSIGINLFTFFNPDNLGTFHIGHGLFCLFKSAIFRWPCCRCAWSIAGWSGPRTTSRLPDFPRESRGFCGFWRLEKGDMGASVEIRAADLSALRPNPPCGNAVLRCGTRLIGERRVNSGCVQASRWSAML